jgi:hypothetical protein
MAFNNSKTSGGRGRDGMVSRSCDTEEKAIDFNKIGRSLKRAINEGKKEKIGE